MNDNIVSPRIEKVCVAGCGSWGTALAALLAYGGHDVRLWGREEDGIETIAATRANEHYLPGVRLPEHLQFSSDFAGAVGGADYLVIAVPAQAVRSFLVAVRDFLPRGIILINAAKGLEIGTGLRISQICAEVMAGHEYTYTVLSGPSHAEEVARRIPTAVTVASEDCAAAMRVQDLFMNPQFRVYTNADVAGVELGGSLKNIIALASGISYGLGFGDNTAAALLTRGLVEMIRIGTALGGDPRTFTGLSGIGDLVVTCGSQHSRNRRAGQLIGQGCSAEEAISQVGMVVEGIHTTRAVYGLAGSLQVEMPICTACYNVLYNGEDPAMEVGRLMQRQKRNETEETLYFRLGDSL